LAGVLASIANSNISAKTYVVDNSPSYDLRATVEDFGAAYIHVGKNVGFGSGHNLALARIGHTSKYHVLLNPDISFGPSVLNELFEFLEINREIGWVMPDIRYPDGSPQNLCKRLPTPWDLFNRRFLSGCRLHVSPFSRDRFECADLDLSRPRSIPCLSGCFAFVRTRLMQEVRGFDERFFMYLEDTDLVRRIGELALTVFYPYAVVYHAHGQGSYKDVKLLRHHLRSAIRYFSKWGWLIDDKRLQINRALASDETPIAVSDKVVDWAMY
jgi:GT2 family glycosyltransferase